MASAARDRALTVAAVGAMVLVADLGRVGHAHLGVPRSGALDLPAHRLANRLVGNDEHAATLECLGGGLRVRVGAATTVGGLGTGSCWDGERQRHRAPA